MLGFVLGILPIDVYQYYYIAIGFKPAKPCHCTTPPPDLYHGCDDIILAPTNQHYVINTHGQSINICKEGVRACKTFYHGHIRHDQVGGMGMESNDIVEYLRRLNLRVLPILLSRKFRI